MKSVLFGGPEAAAAEKYFAAVGRATVLLPGSTAEELCEYDRRGERYYLVHVGANDGEAGGSFERAHYRIELAGAQALAEQLRPRERVLVRLVAFGYKHSTPPSNANLTLDLRALPNPFWETELREFDGRNEAVRQYVLSDPRARKILRDLESLLGNMLAFAEQEERWSFTVALGCTGGRHRSVALAWELAHRLTESERVEVVLEAPQLGLSYVPL
ncbi:MAG: RapZ C-terminal domain-containing protein [Candidatus Dormibacteraceae bacterium]